MTGTADWQSGGFVIHSTELCSLNDENLPLSLAVFVLKLCAVRMVPVFPSVSDMVSVMPIRSTATAAEGGYVFRFPTPLSILKRFTAFTVL